MEIFLSGVLISTNIVVLMTWWISNWWNRHENWIKQIFQSRKESLCCP